MATASHATFSARLVASAVVAGVQTQTSSHAKVLGNVSVRSAALRSRGTGAARFGRSQRLQRLNTTCKVSVGDTAPALTLEDENGRSVSLSKFKGKNVVLYFYPADDTPGCTKEACAFRDAYEDFKNAGAVVLGISSDSPESHQAFKAKHDLPFTLLSDPGNEAREEWGVPKDFLGLLPGRQTYVIDKSGTVKLVFNNQFQPEKHIEKALEIVEAEPAKSFWPF